MIANITYINAHFFILILIFFYSFGLFSQINQTFQWQLTVLHYHHPCIDLYIFWNIYRFTTGPDFFVLILID